MTHGAYVGGEERLQGRSAALRLSDRSGHVLAQFDDITLTEAFGWTEYPETDFEIDED
jgi:hypothetical protein